MEDQFKFKGTFYITARDPDGNITDERVIHNIILNRGRNQMTAILGGLAPSFGNPQDKVNALAIGSDGTAAAATQTGILSLLASQYCESVTQTTTTVTNDTLSLQTVFNMSSSGTINEMAVITNPTPLTLPTTTGIARAVVSPGVAFANGYAITAVYTLKIG